LTVCYSNFTFSKQMGNEVSQTNLNLENILNNCEIGNRKESQHVHINCSNLVELDAKNPPIEDVDWWFKEQEIISCKLPLKSDLDIYHWTPRTHMRDFEVITLGRGLELKIARGQGIGSILFPMMKSYVKFFFDPVKGNIDFVVFAVNTTDDIRKYVNSDLVLGYDVLVKNNNGCQSLCEERDERDDAPTRIMFTEFQYLASFEHPFAKKSTKRYSSVKIQPFIPSFAEISTYLS
jgi:hypothetical protein